MNYLTIPKKQQGELNHNAKLSLKEVQEIRKVASNARQTLILTLAEQYCISTEAINDIVTRRSWRNFE